LGLHQGTRPAVRKFRRAASYTSPVIDMPRRVWAGLAAAVLLAGPQVAAQAPPPPPAQTVTAKPSPTPAAKPSPTPAPSPATAPQGATVVDPRLAGVPMYPGASFLQSVELEKGQWLFVFGSNDVYESVVAFYKSQLGKSTEVARTPAIQQFDLGSFDAGRMSQRPSVLVKDFRWPDAAGYLHVSGTAETRYKTLIQIIPAAK
jgi:hypothetical protein